MHEWPLFIFTLTLQMAIGGMLMLAVYQFKLSKNGTEKVFHSMKLPLLVMTGLSLIGLVASFAHLGSPGNVFNMLGNIGSSWMSREILFTGLFISALVVTTVLAFVQKKVNAGLVILTAVIGLIDVYCMAAIYQRTFISGWETVLAFTAFFGTVLVLGPVLAAALTVPKLQEDTAQGLIKLTLGAAVLGIIIQVTGLISLVANAGEVNMVTGTGVMDILGGYQGTIIARWVIEVLGLGILGYLALGSSKKPSYNISYAALAAILVAEGMSRYVFYVMGA